MPPVVIVAAFVYVSLLVWLDIYVLFRRCFCFVVVFVVVLFSVVVHFVCFLLFLLASFLFCCLCFACFAFLVMLAVCVFVVVLRVERTIAQQLKLRSKSWISIEAQQEQR